MIYTDNPRTDPLLVWFMLAAFATTVGLTIMVTFTYRSLLSEMGFSGQDLLAAYYSTIFIGIVLSAIIGAFCYTLLSMRYVIDPERGFIIKIGYTYEDVIPFSDIDKVCLGVASPFNEHYISRFSDYVSVVRNNKPAKYIWDIPTKLIKTIVITPTSPQDFVACMNQAMGVKEKLPKARRKK